MIFFRLLLPLISIIFFISCSESGSEKFDNETLPNARGADGEIIIVIDSTKNAGPVGEILRDIFRASIPGLPQPEPYFNARFVRPQAVNSVLRLVKSLVYVATIDDNTQGGRILMRNFTDNSIQQIKSKPDLFMLPRPNQFAKGQDVLHLFGKNDVELLNNLEKNKQSIRDRFINVEKERRLESLRKNSKKELSKDLLSKHDFKLLIPFGYDLAKEDSNFVWLRQFDQRIDKNIFIYYQDYRSQELFTAENILRLRNGIGKKYIKDIEVPRIFMTTEERFPPESKEINFKGKYAVESRGLWKLSDLSRGGAFLSYVLVDEELNRIYYIEGYVDSPGEDKRNTMMELESILSTFQTKAEVES
ncbi:MAG: DUF4837 family protein [Bacteroidota bacterium]